LIAQRLNDQLLDDGTGNLPVDAIRPAALLVASLLCGLAVALAVEFIEAANPRIGFAGDDLQRFNSSV
jgi:hypothetical protein